LDPCHPPPGRDGTVASDHRPRRFRDTSQADRFHYKLDRYGHVPFGRIVLLFAADGSRKRLECLGRTCDCRFGGYDSNFGFIHSFLLSLAFDFRTIAITNPRGNLRCCISSVGSPFIGPSCLWSSNLRMVVYCSDEGIFDRYGIGIPADPFYRSFGNRRSASFVA